MKTKNMRNIGAVLLLAVILSTAAFAQRGGPVSGSPTVQLTSEEAKTLTFMREEEKLAHDVYMTLHDAWQAPIFANIALSEQRHMDRIKGLLDRYGLSDPVRGFGEFTDPELQELYDDVVSRGQSSLLAALNVGALIEEVDIDDLQAAIEETDKPDLTMVYENLMRGSRNHLRAFVGQIETLGGDYEAQHLDQAVVDAIVNSPWERGFRGGGRRGFRGNGRGQCIQQQ